MIFQTFAGKLLSPECPSIFVHTTAVYFVPNYLGLYSVKVISTENSEAPKKKLNKTKCDFWVTLG